MRDIRYSYLIDIVDIVKPKSIIEIGVAKGVNAVKMLKAAGYITYTGYDVFDYSDKDFHKMVGNGKQVDTKEEINMKLVSLAKSVDLKKGLTEDTLWPYGDKADLVWLDGDHRIESIKKDFEAVKQSKVVVFDDYYTTPSHQGFKRSDFGCYEVVKDINVVVSPKTIKWPDIRIAVWSDDQQLLNQIKDKLYG